MSLAKDRPRRANAGVRTTKVEDEGEEAEFYKNVYGGFNEVITCLKSSKTSALFISSFTVKIWYVNYFPWHAPYLIILCQLIGWQVSSFC